MTYASVIPIVEFAVATNAVAALSAIGGTVAEELEAERATVCHHS
jgi:hypothetical protein